MARVSVCIGMVIGAGMFITTPLAAANVPLGGVLLAVWIFGRAIALLVLRHRYPDAPRPFRVPGYPWIPLAFIASSRYVLYSSLRYVRIGAVAGVLVLAAGLALLVVLQLRDRGALTFQPVGSKSSGRSGRNSPSGATSLPGGRVIAAL